MNLWNPSSSNASPEPQSEALLRQIRNQIEPEEGMQSRIKQRLEARISAPHILEEARKAIRPESSVTDRVWSSIQSSIEPLSSVSVFDHLRDFLRPSTEVSAFIKQRLMLRLSPVPVPVASSRIKWVAAFVLVVLAVRISPLLFLAPQTIAESPLMLLPTKGEVSVLIGGLWQPVSQELIFTKSALIQTHEGEATLVLHDDGVVRIAPHTTVALHDTSDRPQAPNHDPTLTLHAGEIWVQGLIPAHVNGISVVTSQGKMIVHEGSISIQEGSAGTNVRVWDRKLDVLQGETLTQLVAGERLQLSGTTDASAKKITPSQYDDSWVSQNLRRDAVHRREIAQLQHERRAAMAGILPTSPLYSVKRVAEAVDVLLTFGEEAKTQKRLDQANTRLNEAAALIAEGNSAAALPLQEYKDTVMAMATGSGQGTLVQFLIQQQMKQATVEVAAALPDDPSYLIKQTVYDTSAALPNGFVNTEDVQGVLLVDTLSSLMRSVEEGDVISAKATFGQLKPYLSVMGTGALSLEREKEAKATLSTFAVALEAYEDDVGGIDPEFLKEVAPYLPKMVVVAEHYLTDQELDILVQQIYNRIFVYKLPRSRWNQLMLEFRSIEGHPDRGSILRKLYRILPENGLARYVPSEFVRAKEDADEMRPVPPVEPAMESEESVEGQL